MPPAAAEERTGSACPPPVDEGEAGIAWLPTDEYDSVSSPGRIDPAVVAKMASHAIFQYNILAIDDTHNTWTNMIVKMTILRLLGSSHARPMAQHRDMTPLRPR